MEQGAGLCRGKQSQVLGCPGEERSHGTGGEFRVEGTRWSVVQPPAQVLQQGQLGWARSLTVLPSPNCICAPGGGGACLACALRNACGLHKVVFKTKCET